MDSVIDLAWPVGQLRRMAPTIHLIRPADADLVRAAQDGDQEAFAALHRLHAPMVHGILLAHVPRQEVDDLMQDVFLSAWRRLRELRDRDAFGRWLSVMARNRAHDFHRQKRDDVALTDDVAPDPASGHAAEAAHVLALVKSLPEAYRETLVLRLVEGMTGPEIAERTGLTPGSVRVNLHRGMQLLKEKLGWS
jgi:RNA polymerase sigma-70 factor (ECF subfamily)